MSYIFSLVILLTIDYIAYRYVGQSLLSQYRYTARLMRLGTHVKGRIIGHIDKEDLDQHPQYAPVVEFVDKDGNNRQVTADVYQYKKPDVHTIVDVYYDKEDTSSVIVDLGSILLFRGFLLVMFVTILIGINMGMLYQIF